MITKEEALTVDNFVDDANRKWRRNGATKTWKTRPDKFMVPIKYGLYKYGYITQDNCQYFSRQERNL